MSIKCDWCGKFVSYVDKNKCAFPGGRIINLIVMVTPLEKSNYEEII